ncbi:hypothetical protein E8E13_000104 [Curvularia kusanoi]|uniref:Zn(2)-C6 fungal-type domain-containing protein n=1 Tax=Curvularia kusanoi TaxID=90978 RepID=A0A9P4W330_CURKU|nr:hypothetical protein E8E13_000104 [Curvularia kusanoi]
MESANGQACDRCHRRKTRCDKRKPTCLACEKANTTCTYTVRPKEPLYRRDYVERLERRARQLEINNRTLQERISLTSPAASSSARCAYDVSSMEESALPSSSIMARARQEAANELSFLSTSAGGDRHFLGSASGLYLASLIRAFGPQPNNTTGMSYENRPYRGIDWTTDHKVLPPRQMAKSLIDAYLAHDALCYPIMHPKQVAAAEEAVYAPEEQSKLLSFHGFVFNILLAIATAQVYKFDWQVLPDAETHYQRAMAYVDPILSAGGIDCLQAMLLCCQYKLSSSTKGGSGSLWHMVGIASRMCFELGLHRESTYSLALANFRNGEGALLSLSELQNIHRQCFWCVFCLDRVVSIALGRPLAVRLQDIDVNLPSELPEGDVISPRSSNNAETSRTTAGYQMAVFVHIIRYRVLCGKILDSLHGAIPDTMLTPIERVARRNDLAAELQTWRADTYSLQLQEMDLSTLLAEAHSSFRSEAWYELLYQNGVLLLNRPSPSHASSGTLDEGDSMQVTFTAAKQSITLYGYLFKSRKINFSWITLHAVFLAGLSYVHALSQHLRAQRKQRNSNSQIPRRHFLTQSRE